MHIERSRYLIYAQFVYVGVPSLKYVEKQGGTLKLESASSGMQRPRIMLSSWSNHTEIRQDISVWIQSRSSHALLWTFSTTFYRYMNVWQSEALLPHQQDYILKPRPSTLRILMQSIQTFNGNSMLQVSLKLYQDWQRHCTGTIHPQSWLQVSSLPTHVPMKSATIQETFYTRNMRAGLGVLNKKWMCNIANTVPDHWAPLSSVFRQTAIPSGKTPLADLQL